MGQKEYYFNILGLMRRVLHMSLMFILDKSNLCIMMLKVWDIQVKLQMHAYIVTSFVVGVLHMIKMKKINFNYKFIYKKNDMRSAPFRSHELMDFPLWEFRFTTRPTLLYLALSPWSGSKPLNEINAKNISNLFFVLLLRYKNM